MIFAVLPTAGCATQQVADARNNLAPTLLEPGRKDGALAAAQRAVALRGRRLAHYQATLKAIVESC